MGSWIVMIVALSVFAVIFIWLFATVLGRGEELSPLKNGELETANIQAIRERKFHNIRFSVVPRGYRPEQVDAVISQLIDQLSEAEHYLGTRQQSKKD